MGRFYDADEAQEASLGWTMKEDPGRGHYRAKPQAHRIIEMEAVRTLVSSGVVVVACGGGGVPAVQADGSLTPVEAVVDKDLSSALLARKLGATRFIILTAVDEVRSTLQRRPRARCTTSVASRSSARKASSRRVVWVPRLRRSSRSSTATLAASSHHLPGGARRRAGGQEGDMDPLVKARCTSRLMMRCMRASMGHKHDEPEPTLNARVLRC